MPGHNSAYKMYGSREASDPGASGTITVDRSPHVVGLVSAGAETRTLARPTQAGKTCFLYMRTDGGDITLTVTGGYNEDGDTTFTFSDPGQFLMLVSTYFGSAYVWRKVSDYGLGNIAPADSTVLAGLSGLTATAAEINQAADVTGQIVTLSTTPVAITEADHHNRVMWITKLDGIAITLPTPVAGMKFTFIVSGTITGASTIKSAAGTHLMIGYALMGNDLDNTVVCFRANAASTYDTIDLLGTSNSTGGLEGQIIRITAISSTRWFVEIIGDAAGTEATPFADTVA